MRLYPAVIGQKVRYMDQRAYYSNTGTGTTELRVSRSLNLMEIVEKKDREDKTDTTLFCASK